MLATCIAALTMGVLAASPSETSGTGLGLDLTEKTPEAGAVVVVPWTRGGKLDTAGYVRLVSALESRLPGRTVKSDTALRAMRENNLSPGALKKPEGIFALAQAVWAFRAITVELREKDVLLRAFDTDQKREVGQVRVAGASGLGPSEVNKVARVASTFALSTAPPAVAEAPPSDPEPDLQPLVPDASVTASSESSLSDSDLEDAVRAPVLPPKPRVWKPAFFRAAVGGGAGFGSVNAGGPFASQLAPVRIGAVPDIAVYLGFQPLSLADAKVANAAWSDFVVEGTFRRAFSHASQTTASGTTRCRVDDDEVMLRVGWRYRFSGTYAPRIGLGGGWGQDRLRFNCDLPVASASYRAFDVHLRLLQPLYRKSVWIELVAGPRFASTGDAPRAPGPSVGGDVWAYWQITDFLYTRGGVRLATTRLQQQSDLGVNTLRTSVALELGVSL